MAGDDKKNLTRDDLKLLMESYQNMILMHHTVLDQQSKMSEQLTVIIDNQVVITKHQSDACHELQIIAPKLKEVAVELKNNTSDIDDMEEKLLAKLTEHITENIRDHNSIINKIYFAWIGTGTIIIGLIALATQLLNYNTDIHSIRDVVTKILQLLVQ